MTHVPQAAVDLVKEREGCRLSAYRDTGGVLTIGYGHTADVKPGDTITQDEAEKLLAEDLQRFAAAVDKMVTVPLNDNQLSALISWCYNVGISAAAGSTLVKLLNQGQYDSVPAQLARWKFDNGKVVQGLVSRRLAEAALWSKPIPSRVDAPVDADDNSVAVEPAISIEPRHEPPAEPAQPAVVPVVVPEGTSPPPGVPQTNHKAWWGAGIGGALYVVVEAVLQAIPPGIIPPPWDSVLRVAIPALGTFVAVEQKANKPKVDPAMIAAIVAALPKRS